MTVEPLYLAPISVYQFYLKNKEVQFYACGKYEKKSLKNRTYILGANGKLRLSIPIKQKNIEKKLYKDIEISYAEKWQKDHWNSIISAYRRSPFFEYYEDEIKHFYTNNYQYLSEYNILLSNWIMEKMGVPTIELKDDRIENLNCITNYNDVGESYLQVFSDRFPFQNNLSIIDLLFNMGKKATLQYLLK